MAEKLTLLKHLRLCSETVKTFIGRLLTPFIDATIDALDEIDRVKADNQQMLEVLLRNGGWKTDGAEPYPWYYDITVNGITDADRVDVIFPADAYAALPALSPISETMEGTVRLRAASAPKTDVSAYVWTREVS